MSNKILVLNGNSYANAITGIGSITYNHRDFLNNPKQFMMVLFTGGVDVGPELYGDSSPANICYTNPARDVIETQVFKTAFDNGILMAGICRGFQFLNVMAGGKLMHHIDGHEGGYVDHSMITTSHGTFSINSLHHQMVIPSKHSIITGVSYNKHSNVYIGNNDMPVQYDGPEVEAGIFPAIKALGVQYHPEMMRPASGGFSYFYEIVCDAIDTDWSTFVKLYSEENDIYKTNSNNN